MKQIKKITTTHIYDTDIKLCKMLPVLLLSYLNVDAAS